MNTIEPNQFKELLGKDSNSVLIDVRSPREFRAYNILSAVNIPLDEIDEISLSSIVGKDDPVFLICQSGARSQQAVERLHALGYINSKSINGGMAVWRDSGYPMREGQKAISLERQVRIAAGGLVVAGVCLSLLVHDSFIAISAFVGAGLVFAGVTDTCGMALILARMPWNR
jgi:rhodanese-related sulfurtransferase